MNLVLGLSFFLAILVSCGKTSQTEVKVFKFNIQSNPNEKSKIQALMRDYNLKMGFTALSEAQPGEDANSEIVISKGLTLRNPGKVGFGSWTADTQSKGACSLCVPTDKETDYSMHTQFDAEFFDKRMNSKDPADQTELSTLFMHEIGHGLTMDHSARKDSVMYSEISCLDRSSATCGKDIGMYLETARHFFSSTGNL